jgi:hypothetical protein
MDSVTGPRVVERKFKHRPGRQACACTAKRDAGGREVAQA